VTMMSEFEYIHPKSMATWSPLTRYGLGKCRCPACKAAWNAHNREYRSRVRERLAEEIIALNGVDDE